MDSQYVVSLLLFVVSVSVTPGPNNLMVTASGSRFGYARTLPHIAGITLGFTSLIIAISAGLGSLFTNFPVLQAALKIGGACYLLWLAWRIATASGIGCGEADAGPLTLLQAFMFQWVNPKAWTMGVTGVSTFALDGMALVGSLALITATFAVVSFHACSLWTLVGEKIGQLLDSDNALRRFNASLGILTALSVISIVS